MTLDTATVGRMDHRQVKAALVRLGWTHTFTGGGDLTRHVEDFQRGYALGQALHIDGDPGPKTQAALRHSLDQLDAGLGTASHHFSFAEFRCPCGNDGHPFPSCRRIRVHRRLLRDLEAIRSHFYPHGLALASGYRCPAHNQAAGGASNSQHLYGAAADVPYVHGMSWQAVAALRLFSGIGYARSSGLVRHVDVRHVSGNNTTGGTPDRPTTWVYAE